MKIWSRIKSGTVCVIEYMFYEVVMSTDILKKIYSELLQEKAELELEQNSIVIKLKENEKYIKRLRTEEEESFDAFSPRNQNQDIRNNIDSFEKKSEILSQRNSEIEMKQNELNEKIQGLEQLFQEDKKEEDFSEKRSRQKKKLRKLKEEYLKDLSFVLSKLEFCSRLVDLDPVRCKSELSFLIKALNEKVNGNQEQKSPETNEEV